MRTCFVLLAVLVLASSVMAARTQSTLVNYPCQTVMEAYLCNCDPCQETPGSLNSNVWFKGLQGLGGGVIGAAPGILAIDPGTADLNSSGTIDFTNEMWRNFIPAAKDGFDYTLRNIVMQKVMGTTNECAISPDFFKKVLISPQQGPGAIRTWWPLMYSVPGTTWTLTIDYSTALPYDPDGAGPEQASTRHRAVWCWKLDADFESVAATIILFHQLPFGTCEVPLISDEALYPVLLKLWGAVAAATVGPDADPVAAADALFEFDREVELACVASCIKTRPAPTGPGTGIANTYENPACCKLLADVEYIEAKYGIGVAF